MLILRDEAITPLAEPRRWRLFVVRNCIPFQATTFAGSEFDLSTATSTQFAVPLEDQGQAGELRRENGAGNRAGDLGAQGTAESTPAWKQQVAERLAAHQSRRGRGAQAQQALELDLPLREEVPSRVARVAAAVAERYAHAPSYHDLMAAQAAAALLQAEAAAAAAEASVLAQQAVLAGFEELKAQQDAARMASATRADEEMRTLGMREGLHALVEQRSMQEPAKPGRLPLLTDAEMALAEEVFLSEAEVDEWLAGHEEVYAEPALQPTPLPANLIEFPRQLVAPRKARPRLAEGPLREESDAAPENAQLRIFEVEAAIISTRPDTAHTAHYADWSSIRLDAPAPQFLPVYDAATDSLAEHNIAVLIPLPLQVASLVLRLTAAAVDMCLVLTGFLAFVGAFLFSATQLPKALPAAVAGFGVLLAIILMYQMLFFTLSEATPGMRCMHIALCTFDDENPTRKAMRRRLAAMFLSACPLGLGFAWAWLDGDRLGWHDRMTRTYQRRY